MSCVLCCGVLCCVVLTTAAASVNSTAFQYPPPATNLPPCARPPQLAAPATTFSSPLPPNSTTFQYPPSSTALPPCSPPPQTTVPTSTSSPPLPPSRLSPHGLAGRPILILLSACSKALPSSHTRLVLAMSPNHQTTPKKKQNFEPLALRMKFEH